MIKMTFCVRKREDISHEAFYDYWLNQHGPLVTSHRETLRIHSYQQSHSCLPELGQQLLDHRGMPENYDGIAELWWESEADLMAALAQTEANQALLEDEARFIDHARSTIQLVQEHKIF